MPLATPNLDRTSFVEGRASKKLLFLNLVLAAIYFIGITFFFQRGNQVLFWLLIVGHGCALVAVGVWAIGAVLVLPIRSVR